MSCTFAIASNEPDLILMMIGGKWCRAIGGMVVQWYGNLLPSDQEGVKSRVTRPIPSRGLEHVIARSVGT
jgi:hypothetical protein